MPRPLHVPVCRLHKVTKRNPSTDWRNAQAGRYGAITRDSSGRQQVEVARIERAEGIVIPDDKLCELARPRTNEVRGPHLEPLPIKIDRDAATLTHHDIEALIEAHLLVRDGQWRRYLARVDELTADMLEGQAIFAGDKP